MKNQQPSPKIELSASLLLWLLLSADFVFITLHILFKSNILLSNYFSVRRDLGYSEFFQYIKFLWVILLLIYIIKKTRLIEFSAWLAVFIYFLVDDAFQIREDVAGNIAETINFIPPFNLRPQDIGELVFAMVAGLFLCLFLLWAYRRGAQTFKNITIDLFIFFIAMAFFSVFVDMAEIAVDLGIFIKETLGLIDDGGEMIVSSFMLWYIFKLALNNGNANEFIYRRFLAHSKIKIRIDDDSLA